MKRIALLVLTAFVLASCPGQQDTESLLRGLALSVTYNNVRWLSSHNSYDRDDLKNDLRTQLEEGVRSFELDLHQANDRRGDWAVFHSIGGDGDFCNFFRDCLSIFREWHRENPEHVVVTIFLDMKDDWENAHYQEPGDLDLIIETSFGILEGPDRLNYHLDSVFGPEDLRHWPPREHALFGGTLREIVGTLGWPALYELQGKFVFVLMGNGDAVNAYPTDWDHYGYYDQTYDGRSAVIQKYVFIAPNLNSSAQINAEWPPHIVFANIAYRSSRIPELWWVPQTAHRAGVVTRAWKFEPGSSWHGENYAWALANPINHIATDHISREQFEPRMRYPPLGIEAEPIE